MFLGLDLAHWEFIGIIIGLALAAYDISSGERVNPAARRILLGFAALLSLTCVVLLFGFSGARLQIPISFKWPIIFPQPTASPTVHGCQLTVTVESHLTARLYFRHRFPKPGIKITVPMDFEELFYDWNVLLQSDSVTRKTFVEIAPIKHDDAIDVVPENAQVSAPLPRWLSGHSEVNRTPDYYVRQITIDRIGSDLPAKIMVRRSLAAPAIDASDALHVVDVRSTPCVLIKHFLDTFAEADQLNHEATMLTRPPGVSKLKHDVGNVPADEGEATIEVTCANRACTRMKGSKLIGRLGRRVK